MMIAFECKCGKRLKYRDESRGKTAKCRSCGNSFTIGDAGEGSSNLSEDELLSLIEAAVGKEGLARYGDFSSELAARQKIAAEKQKKDHAEKRREEKGQAVARGKRKATIIVVALLPIIYLALSPFINLVIFLVWKRGMGGSYSEMPFLMRLHGFVSCFSLVCWIAGTIYAAHDAKRREKEKAAPQLIGCGVAFMFFGMLLGITSANLRINKFEELNETASTSVIPTLKKELPPLIGQCNAAGPIKQPVVEGTLLVLDSIGGDFFGLMFKDRTSQTFLGSRCGGYHQLLHATPEQPVTVFIHLTDRDGGSEKTLYVEGNESMPVKSIGKLVDFAVIRYPERTPRGIATLQLPPENFETIPGFHYDRNNPPVVHTSFDPSLNSDQERVAGWLNSLPAR